VEIDQHAHGVVAAKQANVKFFSSGKKEKKTGREKSKRGKNNRADKRSKGGGRGRNSFSVRGYDDDDDDDDDDGEEDETYYR